MDSCICSDYSADQLLKPSLLYSVRPPYSLRHNMENKPVNHSTVLTSAQVKESAACLPLLNQKLEMTKFNEEGMSKDKRHKAELLGPNSQVLNVKEKFLSKIKGCYSAHTNAKSETVLVLLSRKF